MLALKISTNTFAGHHACEKLWWKWQQSNSKDESIVGKVNRLNNYDDCCMSDLVEWLVEDARERLREAQRAYKREARRERRTRQRLGARRWSQKA